MESKNKSPVYIVGPMPHDYIVSKVFAWSTLYFFLLVLSEAICSCVMRHLMVVKNNEIQDLDEWSLALVIRHSIYIRIVRTLLPLSFNAFLAGLNRN